jgi:hypothetical protein
MNRFVGLPVEQLIDLLKQSSVRKYPGNAEGRAKRAMPLWERLEVEEVSWQAGDRLEAAPSFALGTIAGVIHPISKV